MLSESFQNICCLLAFGTFEHTSSGELFARYGYTYGEDELRGHILYVKEVDDIVHVLILNLRPESDQVLHTWADKTQTITVFSQRLVHLIKL